MNLAGSIKGGALGGLVAVALASCGGGGDSPSQTVSQLPTVTAPPLTTSTQPQKGAPATSATQPETTAAAPSGSSGGASSQDQGSRPEGSGKPTKQTKAERRKQRSCEKQVAHLPSDQQREALAQCLNPTPPTPEAPETQVQR